MVEEGYNLQIFISYLGVSTDGEYVANTGLIPKVVYGVFEFSTICHCHGKSIE